ncbi:DUF7715 family protein [Glaciibacter sp. 2TAF33]|uniref:DUF7715 family protein n=1 Tax=Glaciibacter sp. 2TAF33 TaxID=3233015 RepID=UPI003F8EFAEE
MKVLVATRQTQGDRVGDFSDTIEGELVFDAGPCEQAVREQSWECICSMGFVGLASGELTTTAVVANLPVAPREFERLFRDSLAPEGICADCAKDMAQAARAFALRWPLGTVIERNRFDVRPRKRP